MNDQKPQNSEEAKQLVDQTLMNTGVDDNVQQMINKPESDPTGIDEGDLEYIERVMGMVENGTINVFTPTTLLNRPVYDKLDENTRRFVDVNAFNLLAEIRQIKKLWDMGDKDSFQIQNLVERMRDKKENIETQHGDCYII